MKQKRIRDMTWDDYGISKNRYKELRAFCLQYDEKKAKIKYGISSLKYGGAPGASYPGSPTEAQAISNIANEKDCRMIEEAAKRADPDVWRYILKSVTQGLSYEFVQWDSDLGKIPMCGKEFYGVRKLFYSILDKMQMDQKRSVKM